jgi:hypothetical protein
MGGGPDGHRHGAVSDLPLKTRLLPGLHWCFGGNRTYGYLGTGDASAFTTPNPQTVVDLDGGGALFPVGRVVGGGDMNCAVLVGSCGPTGPGQVVCWGYGLTGNLGNDAGGNSAVPVQVLAP